MNEANIRATPKTSSPVWGIVYESGIALSPHKDWISGRNWGPGIGILTISDLRTKRDILGGGALDLLLGRHCNQSSNASRLGGRALLKISGKYDRIFKGLWRNLSLE